MFKKLDKKTVDTMRSEGDLLGRSTSELQAQLRQLATGEALQINKSEWFMKKKVAPNFYGLIPKKFSKYTSSNSIYWIIVREK
ncbi:MAG: hypothetical protein AABY22_29245 [Nanoarchaeota archaeon]